MIFKYELVEAINALNLDVAGLTSDIHELRERVLDLEKKTKTTAKKGPGRPKKSVAKRK